MEAIELGEWLHFKHVDHGWSACDFRVTSAVILACVSCFNETGGKQIPATNYRNDLFSSFFIA